MGECLRGSEHGYLGLVGQVQFGKDRHLLSPIVAVRFDGSANDREVDRNQTWAGEILRLRPCCGLI